MQGVDKKEDEVTKPDPLREQIYRSKRMAGQVRRYHAWPTLREQTVADHCWRVACIYCELFGIPRGEVLFFCLHHDSGELFAGDLPFGGKSRCPGMKEAVDECERMGLKNLGIELPMLRDEERRKVKLCDLLEMWEFGSVEARMGNMLAMPVVDATREAAEELAYDLCCYDRMETWMGENRWH